MTDLTHRPQYEDMQLEDPGHTRAFVKIQDGCNQFCSYCIIPYARGRIRSRRPGEILKEIRTIAGKGIREVVLTGIHVSSYGLEWDARTDNVPFDPLIRLSPAPSFWTSWRRSGKFRALRGSA